MKKNNFTEKTSQYILRNLTYILTFIFLCTGSNLLTAAPDATGVTQQGIKITGVVKDANSEAIPGVSVLVKGTSTGASTDVDGRYSIQVPNSDASLVFSFIGYQNHEVKVGSQREINVVLSDDVKQLEEVVVVGYGVQRKSDVTGAINVATAKDILASPVSNAMEGLKGKAAGVNVYANTGDPMGLSETGPRVIIRGMNSINTSTDPLYVIDGVQMNEFHYINPNDIERIEVLKDASATAIYGARGANGVILVTTRRGTGSGDGTTVSYSGWVSVGTLPKKVDLMNSKEFMAMEDAGFNNFSKYEQSKKYAGLKVDRSDPKLFDAQGNPLYDTDWQDEVIRDAVSQSHQLSIQQQNKTSAVGAFFNIMDNEGLLLNNYEKRLNGRFTYDSKPKKWLDFSTNIMINHTWGNAVDGTGGGQTARRTMWEMPPIIPVKFPDGSWTSSQFQGNKLNFGLEAMANPVQELTTRKRNRYRTKIFGNTSFTFHLMQGLDLKTQLGYDANIRSNKDFSPNDLINISSPNGSASMYNGTNYYWQEETFLTYNKFINKLHRINGTLGMSWSQYTDMSSNTGNVTGFSTNFFGYDNLGAGTTPSAPTSSWSRWAMNSYFARGSYNYNDRYLATATIRVDGSSRFGANNKYGLFPSLGLGWVMSNEKFMEGTSSWLSNLKLHSSYGRTGNSEIDVYSTLATISSGTALLNGVRAATNEMARMPNPDLKWEKTDQFDLGVNLGLFKNRITLEADYYYKKTSDLLLSRPLPFTSGFSSVMDNIGRVDNQGFDFMVNTVNIQNRDFNWETTLNFNYNQNEIKKLGANNEDILTDPGFVGGNVILRVGQPLSSFYGYVRQGTWGTNEAAEAAKVGAVPGEAKRKKDREIIGNGIPKFTGSFINKFNYKNFDLTVDLQFVAGVDAWQLYMHAAEDRSGIANGLKTILYDGWTEKNQNTMIQQIRQQNYSGQNSNSDSHWVCDGSYLRGNLFQLGYSFDNKMLKKCGLKNLRVKASVNNAFVLTSKDFKGYDPEGSSNTNRFGQNIFFYEYPKPRTYTLGVDLTF